MAEVVLNNVRKNYDPAVHKDTLRNINFIEGSNFADTITGSTALIFEQIEGLGGNDTLAVDLATSFGATFDGGAGSSDLLIMDFLTLHASGHNTSRRSRWSMQSRLFNFREPTGVSHAWRGSYAAG